MTFKEFNLHNDLIAGIEAAGFKAPTPIQSKTISLVMQGRDIIGVAQTGTGKTAAFSLPIMHRILADKRVGPRALIVAPTRELAEQIDAEINRLGSESSITSVAIFGGVSMRTQINQFKHKPDIIVACPGRLLDHYRRRNVDLRRVEALVLDEADRMLDMGFMPDVEQILQIVKGRKQTLLFSATMPAQVKRLADRFMTNPEEIKVGEEAPAETIEHILYRVISVKKNALLYELLKIEKMKSVLIFAKTKHRARVLGRELGERDYDVNVLEGDLNQSQRKQVMSDFREGDVKIMVATDIASRGLDITNISHVINYDMPDTPEGYLHRIGRTGRAERSGIAYSLITLEDESMVQQIEKMIDQKIERRGLEGYDYLGAPEDQISRSSRKGRFGPIKRSR